MDDVPLPGTLDSPLSPGRRRALRGAAVIGLAIVVGAGYGLVTRLAFGIKKPPEPLVVMTVAFIFTVPFTMGFVTNAICWIGGPVRWFWRVLVPPATAILSLSLAMVFNLEGLICVIIWLPVYGSMVCTGAGAAEIVFQIYRSMQRRAQIAMCVVAALLPYMTGAIESRLVNPLDVRTVVETIDIRADPETVWRNVREVRTIEEREQYPSAVHRIGFPRPLEARLVGEGVGATRLARFEGNVLFVETVNLWDPPRSLAFAIKADTDAIPATTLDEHVTVGGPYFDVLEGRFDLEPRPGGIVALHLTSRHRLSTPFNSYARLWTDFIMRDIQRSILRIIRDRCEAESGSVGP